MRGDHSDDCHCFLTILDKIITASESVGGEERAGWRPPKRSWGGGGYENWRCSKLCRGAVAKFAEEWREHRRGTAGTSPRHGGNNAESRREHRRGTAGTSPGTPAVIRALQEVREDHQRRYQEKPKYKIAYL
jgi:hypothetical protein